jgi:hypothetical protein
MKLRHKEGETKFFAIHGSTVYRTDLVLGTQLNKIQLERMNGKPELIHMAAHLLAEKFTDNGVRPRIHALAIGELNYRIPQYIIDPHVDLAAVPLWSMPYKFVTRQAALEPTHEDLRWIPRYFWVERIRAWKIDFHFSELTLFNWNSSLFLTGEPPEPLCTNPCM